MNQADVLIVEDDVALCEALSDTLEMEGLRVITAHNGADALGRLGRHGARLVISDVQMAKMDGLVLLKKIKTAYPCAPVLLMTAYGTIQKAVEAVQAGACDYLVKPFEADVLINQVYQYIAPSSPIGNERIVADAAMKKLYALAAKVAKSEATVLVQGESGTGKELVARYIHEQSPRRSGPFAAINCAAIPENMLEAELFGYEKGAFTGAWQSVPGKFELAAGGTLLLDEISEMNVMLQAKLLRVLQERAAERLGGRKSIDLDVRVVATTNRNLKQQISRGEFREDLYYRLYVFPLHVPSLRERRSDILPLARALMQRHWKSGKVLPELSPEAEKRLEAYHWPGNVRELENVVQRALIVHTEAEIDVEDLIFMDDDWSALPGLEPPGNATTAESGLGEGLRSAEEKIILETLCAANGSRKSTAVLLGISQRTLRYKLARMRQAGIQMPD